jgi:hypothetical protein
MIAHKCFAPGNAGGMLSWDIVCPIIGFALLSAWQRSRRPASAIDS